MSGTPDLVDVFYGWQEYQTEGGRWKYGRDFDPFSDEFSDADLLDRCEWKRNQQLKPIYGCGESRFPTTAQLVCRGSGHDHLQRPSGYQGSPETARAGIRYRGFRTRETLGTERITN